MWATGGIVLGTSWVRVLGDVGEKVGVESSVRECVVGTGACVCVHMYMCESWAWMCVALGIMDMTGRRVCVCVCVRDERGWASCLRPSEGYV